MASRILEDLSGDLELFERIDTVSAQKITEILRTLQSTRFMSTAASTPLTAAGGSRAHAPGKSCSTGPFVAKARACGRPCDLPVLTLRHAAITASLWRSAPTFTSAPATPSISAVTVSFCGDN